MFDAPRPLSPPHQATYKNEGSCASLGKPQQPCTITNPDLPGGIRGIIPQQQFFKTTAAAIAGAAPAVDAPQVVTPSHPPPAFCAASGDGSATPATTGGYSPALDYVPVYVGYWSCQDTEVGAAQ